MFLQLGCSNHNFVLCVQHGQPDLTFYPKPCNHTALSLLTLRTEIVLVSPHLQEFHLNAVKGTGIPVLYDCPHHKWTGFQEVLVTLRVVLSFLCILYFKSDKFTAMPEKYEKKSNHERAYYWFTSNEIKLLIRLFCHVCI